MNNDTELTLTLVTVNHPVTELMKTYAGMEAVKMELAAAGLKCMDAEAVLEFAQKLDERPKRLWLQSSAE